MLLETIRFELATLWYRSGRPIVQIKALPVLPLEVTIHELQQTPKLVKTLLCFPCSTAKTHSLSQRPWKLY